MPTRPIQAIFMDWSTLIGMGPWVRLRRQMAQDLARHVPGAAMVAAMEVGVGRRVETRSISRQASKL